MINLGYIKSLLASTSQQYYDSDRNICLGNETTENSQGLFNIEISQPKFNLHNFWEQDNLTIMLIIILITILLFYFLTIKYREKKRLGEKRTIQHLADRANTKAYQLEILLNPSANNQFQPVNNTIAALRSIESILNRLHSYPLELPQKSQPNKQLSTSANLDLLHSYPLEPRQKSQPNKQLSTTAKKIIELRDGILLARSDENQISEQFLNILDRKLDKILEIEGVRTIEETGAFNYEIHQVVDTEITEDPAKNEQICSTVRPGYLFNNKLIRPQEVIVYTFDK